MEIPSVKAARPNPALKGFTNGKTITNQASQGQKAPSINPPKSSDQDPAGSVPQGKETQEDIVVESKGHLLVIKDQIGDRTQFFRYFVHCSCNWEARVKTFEMAKHAADNHVYVNTRPRVK